MSIRQKSSTVFPDLEKIKDPEIKQVLSDLFKVLQSSLTDAFDDTNQAARWEVDGTETQLITADELDMQSKKIINVTDPSAAQDASTKTYTDTKISKTTAAEISAMTEKTSLADGDHFLIEDSAESNAKKRVQKSNIASDKISKTIAGEIAAMTEKTTLADADLFLIEDSAAGNAKKKVKNSNIAAPVLSNVIFSWLGKDVLTGAPGSTDPGLARGTTQVLSGTSIENEYWVANINGSASYATIVPSFKWKKIPGVSTLSVYLRAWVHTPGGSVTGVNYRCDVGSGTATGTSSLITSTTPAWLTVFTVDVSGLTNGSVYDIEITRANDNAVGAITACVSAIVILGS